MIRVKESPGALGPRHSSSFLEDRARASSPSECDVARSGNSAGFPGLAHSEGGFFDLLLRIDDRFLKVANRSCGYDFLDQNSSVVILLADLADAHVPQ
jgi:hypothetical protein